MDFEAQFEQPDWLHLGAVAVTAVLARRDGQWYLAAFAPHIRGCNLSTVQEPASQREKFHLWCDAVFVQSGAPLEGISFYPTLYYRGCQVAPQHWHFESEAPILNCFLQPEDIGPALFGGVPVPDYVTQFPEFLRLAQQDGWNWDMKDGGTKYIHVDDLEKIEGPPPEGPF